MDITDINKVASRKRMNTDAEKLREKVSRETAKIIKLKVAQDTAYWDLKERLQQLEGAHERLQQNMVDVQMQHEAASAHFAHELRLRPDTLNKVAATRGMCAALEHFGERLRRSVARARADRAALQAAYAQCGARVRLLAAQLGAARAAAARHAAAARRTRQQLGGERARLQRAEAAAAAVRDDVARLLRQFDAQVTDMKQTIARLEHEAQGARAAAEARRREAAARADELRRLQAQLQEANNTIDHMKKEEVAQMEEIKNLKSFINDKEQHEQNMEAEMSAAKEQVRKLETEKAEANEQLRVSEQQNCEHADALRQLRADCSLLQNQRDDARLQLQQLGAEHEQRARELGAALADKERALATATGSIARLMAELRAESDARARADAEHARALRAKDDELAQGLAVLRDVRGDKERLQERIQAMQNTIDNIQKELTGRAPPAAAAEPAEHDVPDATLYSFLSDGSVDGDALDAREVGRRFEALAGAAVRGLQARATHGSISLSQVKDDLKTKSRTFFKNKRFDTKIKKFK